MAFETWGAVNRETVVPLVIDYSKEYVKQPAGSYASIGQYKYTRHATKTYAFRGMTEAAVKACLAEKKRQYMRRQAAWIWQGATRIRDDETKDTYVQVATFAVSRREVVYDLQITVDETEIIYASAAGRDYDPLTEEGCRYIESFFQVQASAVHPESYVWKFLYDEPGEEDA